MKPKCYKPHQFVLCILTYTILFSACGQSDHRKSAADNSSFPDRPNRLEGQRYLGITKEGFSLDSSAILVADLTRSLLPGQVFRCWEPLAPDFPLGLASCTTPLDAAKPVSQTVDIKAHHTHQICVTPGVATVLPAVELTLSGCAEISLHAYSFEDGPFLSLVNRKL